MNDGPHLTVFEEHRDRLFAVAYRMTGSVADADDLCQEAWLRWSEVELATVRQPEAFLVSTMTRLSIDRLRSASHRREIYVGPYLPEPLMTEPPAESDPERAAELADSLTYAFLVLMDELAPAERAVFLLHDVFGYPFNEIGDAVDRSPDAVRQMASRTRRKLDAERVELSRFDESAEQDVMASLVGAIAAGDVEGLMALLAPDIVQLDDGGPSRRAARRPIIGPNRVARLWVNLAKRVQPDWTMEFARVNGSPGLVFGDAEGPFMVIAIEFGPDRLIRRIHAQLNPEKLVHLR